MLVGPHVATTKSSDGEKVNLSNRHSDRKSRRHVNSTQHWQADLTPATTDQRISRNMGGTDGAQDAAEPITGDGSFVSGCGCCTGGRRSVRVLRATGMSCDVRPGTEQHLRTPAHVADGCNRSDATRLA